MLKASTEVAWPGEVRPPAELVHAILEVIDKGDVQQLDDCLSDDGFKASGYATLLRAVKVFAGVDRRLWFVRPSLRPYCMGMYGAHSFQYYLLEEQWSGSRRRYRLLFQRRGDFFVVYRRQSHGLNDIEATGCIAIECRSARMSFDGQHYQTVRCSHTTWDDNHREVIEARPCGSDYWGDDQASGFALRSGD